LITNIKFHITGVVDGLSTDSSWKSPSYRGIKLGMLARFSSEPPEADMAGTPCAAVIESTKAPCTFKPNLPSKYCNKHKVLWERKDEVAAAGGRECKQLATHVKRGCLGMLDADDKSYCKACKRMNAEKDKKVDARREAAAVASLRPGQVVCNNCKEPKDASEFDERALSHATKGAYCRDCREKREGVFRQKPEGKRVWNEPYLEWRRRYELSDERRANKQARYAADPERHVQYWRDSRARRLAEDPVGYRAQAAAAAKAWRDRNPDMVQANAVKNRVNLKKCAHRTRATLNECIDTLTDEEVVEMLEGVCFYCGEAPPVDKLMGIGRLEIGAGYTADNCRSVCTECIRMKGSLDALTFVERCEHISAFSGGGASEYPVHIFGSHQGATYDGYREKAFRKGLEFDLTTRQFLEIVAESCYICGNVSDGARRNGIDRVDNTKGYVEGNMRACCGECNSMKKKADIDEFRARVDLVAERAQQVKADLPELKRTIYVVSKAD
jgi:hypothetical protein